ncbi:hypothetical protein ACQEVC_17320 [Plantactinospora sp. CA-294935]|uniref:hypothetical protein n=1 Tax=Plantactinospora sp. CA-294935 TaxID=3240012 RepID=UPI003D8E19CE
MTTVPSAVSGGGSAVAAPGWVPSRYGGALSTRHVAAVARTALSARGFRPDLATLGRSVAAEVVRRDELVGSVLPARWPELDAAWRQTTGPVTERLPAMLAIGERHARLLHRIAGGADDDTASEVGLLGGLFNATIATIDTVGDAGDRRLLAALTPPALRSLLGGGNGRTATLDAFRRRTYGHPSARTAVELMGAWTALAGRVLGRSGNTPAWTRLRGTLHSLLEAQRAVTGAGAQGGPGGTARDVPGLLAATWLKSAGPSTAIAQMVALAHRADDPPPQILHRAARRLGLVFCLADDLADLVDDARAGRPNLHLLRGWPDGGWLSDPAVYATIDRAAAELGAIVRPTGGTDDEFAAEVATRWLRWDEDERRAAPPVELAGADGRAARAAVTRLLVDRAGGHPGARHALTLPRGRVGAERTETHSDLVFARAVALDALVDAYDAGLPVPHGVLCAEAVGLLLGKHPDVRGGWNYLRSLPELPPDTDDLAQVMQALARLGGRPLAAACDEAVRVALDGGDGSGAVPTWIVDHRRGGARDVEMARYVEVVGGGGAHPEVVANLLVALHRTDPIRYGRVVAAGARYLAGAQQPDGSWTSAWYAGPYYGTFRASTVLAAVPGWPEQCGRARDFLLARQHPDGGWDDGDRASLSTAFAVLGLCALDPHGCRDAIAGGAGWLRAGQRVDGGWPAGPWIEFPTRDGRVSYRSPTATAAFCLQALLAAARAGGTAAVPP